MSFFSLLDRVLGFVLKIFLSRKLGAANLGVYQVSLSFFMVLLTLITSGMPLILSKETARLRAKKDLGGEGASAAAALIINTAFALILCTLILVFNRLIGRLFADDRSRVILLMMLPALLFSAVYSSLRGNLWGREKYAVVSLLEIAEQLARISVCVIMFSLGFDKLKTAGLAISAGCLVAAIICVICFFASGARLKNPRRRIVPLIKESAPVTASRAATAAVGSLNGIVAPYLLIRAGLSSEGAMYQYGFSMGMAMPLLYIPLTVVGALAFVMIPTLSQASAQNDAASLKRHTQTAIKMSAVLALLFFPLFFVLGEPIGRLVYDNADAGLFLRRAAWLLLPISLESITSSMMNSLDMERRGFVNYLIGAALTFLIFFACGAKFNVNLMLIGMGAGWILSTGLDFLAIRKKIKIEFGFLFTLIVAGGLCIPAVFLTKWLYALLIECFAGLKPQLALFLKIALSGGCGLVFLTVMNFIFGTVKIEYFLTRRKKPVKGHVKTVAN